MTKALPPHHFPWYRPDALSRCIKNIWPWFFLKPPTLWYYRRKLELAARIKLTVAIGDTLLQDRNWPVSQVIRTLLLM